MKKINSGTRMMKRKMWNGRAEPEGVVGIGKKGAMPVPTPIVNIEACFFHPDSSYLCHEIESTSPW